MAEKKNNKTDHDWARAILANKRNPGKFTTVHNIKIPHKPSTPDINEANGILEHLRRGKKQYKRGMGVALRGGGSVTRG